MTGFASNKTQFPGGVSWERQGTSNCFPWKRSQTGVWPLCPVMTEDSRVYFPPSTPIGGRGEEELPDQRGAFPLLPAEEHGSEGSGAPSLHAVRLPTRSPRFSSLGSSWLLWGLYLCCTSKHPCALKSVNID